MSKIPQYGVPLTPEETSLGLPFYPVYGVTPGNEYIPLQITGDGKLVVSATFSGSITIGEIGTADKTNFIYGTSLEQPMGGVYQDTSPTLSAGQTGVLRLTQYRGLHSNLRDSSGNELLGQSLSAESLPVVIASDQSTIPVSFSGDVSVVQSTASDLLTSSWLSDGSGNPISSTTGSLNVNVTNASGLDTVNQGNPNTLANAWPVSITDGINVLGTSTNPLGVMENDTTATGTITSNQSVTLSINGTSSVAFSTSGTWSGTLVIEGSVDGTNYFSLSAATFTSGLIFSSFSANNQGQINVSGLSSVRIRGNTVATGTATVSLRGNSSAGPVILSESLPQGGNTIGSVSQTGTWNVVATPPALPAAAAFGQAAIATTGTAVQLAAASLVNGIVVTANGSNVASIVVGLSGVTNVTNGTGNGYVLAAGASIGIAASNASSLWINGTSADSVSYVGS